MENKTGNSFALPLALSYMLYIAYDRRGTPKDKSEITLDAKALGASGRDRAELHRLSGARRGRHLRAGGAVDSFDRGGCRC